MRTYHIELNGIRGTYEADNPEHAIVKHLHAAGLRTPAEADEYRSTDHGRAFLDDVQVHNAVGVRMHFIDKDVRQLCEEANQ